MWNLLLRKKVYTFQLNNKKPESHDKGVTSGRKTRETGIRI